MRTFLFSSAQRTKAHQPGWTWRVLLNSNTDWSPGVETGWLAHKKCKQVGMAIPLALQPERPVKGQSVKHKRGEGVRA